MSERYVLESPAAAAAACGGYVLERLAHAVAARGRAALAISGGSSPRPMFEGWARSGFDWSRVDIFWVDERGVPPDDPQSNYRFARETFLDPAGVPASSIHRIEAELDPQEAAQRYREAVTKVDRFDVIHLGVGPDAHTASLFPGEPLIADRAGDVAAVYVPKFSQWRITLLPARILAARYIVVLAAGADKAGALHQVLEGPEDPLTFPAQILRHAEGEVAWFLDSAAAGQLSSAAR
jgi:6-phosphogluconolactonase